MVEEPQYVERKTKIPFELLFLSSDFNLKFSKELVRDRNWNQRFLYEKMFLFVFVQSVSSIPDSNTFSQYNFVPRYKRNYTISRLNKMLWTHNYRLRVLSSLQMMHHLQIIRQPNNTKSAHDIQQFFVALSDILVISCIKKKLFHNNYDFHSHAISYFDLQSRLMSFCYRIS